MPDMPTEIFSNASSSSFDIGSSVPSSRFRPLSEEKMNIVVIVFAAIFEGVQICITTKQKPNSTK
jgi:hypothetical protein